MFDYNLQNCDDYKTRLFVHPRLLNKHSGSKIILESVEVINMLLFFQKMDKKRA